MPVVTQVLAVTDKASDAPHLSDPTDGGNPVLRHGSHGRVAIGEGEWVRHDYQPGLGVVRDIAHDAVDIGYGVDLAFVVTSKFRRTAP